MTPGGLKRFLWLGAAIAALGILAMLYVGPRMTGHDVSHGAAATPAMARYHCPMHPTMVSDHPGDCPICGMRLVPIETADAPDSAASRAWTPAQGSSAESPAGSAQGKRVVYRSTMNPGEISDHPGKDSMGMEMVPEEVDEVSPTTVQRAVDGRVAVNVSEQKRQLIGVRTTPVRRQPFDRTIRAVGRITYDESRLRHVHTRTAGWVERLYANTTGQLVREGEPLLTIYSPELVASAQEYLLARRARERLAGSELAGDSSERLVSAARERLRLFHLSPQEISALERTGVVPTTMPVHAPIGGYIISRNVTEGERIEPGMNLLDVVDLSQVWVLADIYEYELPFVRVGDAVSTTLSYLPGQVFEGRISLIYPVLAESTRTAKVRVEIANRDLSLKPEMYAQVEIRASLGERLAVPDTAVISTGARDIVFVDRGDGYLEPRRVSVGVRLPDRFEILSGVTEGERVLVSGNFLIDSESKIKAAIANVSGGAPAAGPGGEGEGHSGGAAAGTPD